MQIAGVLNCMCRCGSMGAIPSLILYTAACTEMHFLKSPASVCTLGPDGCICRPCQDVVYICSFKVYVKNNCLTQIPYVQGGRDTCVFSSSVIPTAICSEAS